MHLTLRQSWRAAFSDIDRTSWLFGCAIALTVSGLCIILSVRLIGESAATALIKIQFVATNSASLTPEQYAAKGFGWSPAVTESYFVQSEIFVRKALQRLNPGVERNTILLDQSTNTLEAVAVAHNRLLSMVVPEGIRIWASGRNAHETAALVNALAEAYRDERNEAAPPPPGCKALSVSIAEMARPVAVPPYVLYVCRCALSTLLLGLAGMLWFSGKWMSVYPSVIPVFLFWLSSSLGIGALIGHLTLGSHRGNDTGAPDDCCCCQCRLGQV